MRPSGQSARTLRNILPIAAVAALSTAACNLGGAGGGADPTPAAVDGVPAYMIKGDPGAKVTLVEWSDYQCPFCAQHTRETAPRIEQDYVETGKVRVMFRDLPLTQIHPQAAKAAEAARCAGELGAGEGYWGMHDHLFETQDAWSGQEGAAEHFKGLAGELGLDGAAFAACLDGGAQAAAVQADLAEAQKLGLSGTPSFTVAGAVLEGALPFEEFQKPFDILVAGGTLPTATPPPPTPKLVEIDAPTYEVDLGDAPAKGDPDAPITVVEFSDYQCPYCAEYVAETYPVLNTEFIAKGRVRYVFKDFPLTQIHPQAPAAAQAAHCARDEGGDEAYWKMHDALFAGQDRWAGQSAPAPVFGELAREQGLDGDRLAACVESGRHQARVDEAARQAQSLGLSGTPSFFFNGYMKAGVPSPEALTALLEQLERGEALKMMVPEDVAGTLEPGTPGTPPPTGTPVAVDTGDAPVKGDAGAPVTIVEFSDFQCPYCAAYATDTYPEIVKRFVDAGKVRYVFKDFPLAQIHPQAPEAAEAARCARDQGGDEAFWAMHDKLFAAQAEWSEQPDAADRFATYAAGLGLDRAALSKCLAADTHAAAVQADFEAGRGYGVEGTPSFFVNGRLIAGAMPLADFEAVIEEAAGGEAARE